MKNKNLFWLYILSTSIYFTQGIEGLPGTALFAYLKEYLKLAPNKVMYITAIISIPWLIKPLWGFFIDRFLSSKVWIILSLLGSILVSLYFGLSPYLTIPLIIIISILGNLSTAWRDISNDGLACIEGKESNTCNIFQNVQWTAITIAGIITSLAGGWIADHFNYKFAYLLLIPIYLIILMVISKYKKNNPIKELKNFYHTSVYQYKKNNSIWQQILSYKELFTNKLFMLGCLFIFLFNFNPAFGTYLNYIKRDIFHWSWTFMGQIDAISMSVSILGSILYWKFSKKINIKKLLYFAIFLGALTTLSYLYFTPITAIIYSIVYSIMGMFIFLNIMTFMAQATISGKEATSFALLCSINNLAGTCSTLVGAYLFPKIGLNFLICLSAITSFLCLPLIKHLNFKK